MNKELIHEGMDRTHMVIVMLQNSLGFYDPDCELSDGWAHPSIWNSKCEQLLSKATATLSELYLAIGEYVDENV